MMPQNALRSRLLRWYRTHQRDLPWRRTRDPYRIWVSEVILQQTRVDQGLPYYRSFLRRFPTIRKLAAASEQQVLKAWEGMGYYSRARNLHAAARHLMSSGNGTFPSDYEEIMGLKGIGPYTAAAIGSIAFGIREPVLDGNVFRFLARYYGIDRPVDGPQARNSFLPYARALMDGCRAPGTLNQALMEFGALQCTPASPDCIRCPLRNGCRAFLQGMQGMLPVRSLKRKVRSRYFHFLVVRWKGHVVLHQRGNRDIWRGLFEFPLVESSRPGLENATLARYGISQEGRKGLPEPGPLHKHQLTHQTLHVRYYEVHLSSKPQLRNPALLLVPEVQLDQYPVPRIISRYLEAAHG